ncbi:MAG: hypothetical protein QOF76_4612, partial [Solirubrobacteraceae bacterium]|nr:hypothetical protein [Solirubrobacteraceae bacterium]
MSIDLKLPQLGVEMNSAILVEWLCAEGDPIAEGEPIAIVETDKVTFEIKAPGAGVLRKVAELSEEYAVGDLLAVIATDGETAVNGAAPQRRRARDGVRASPLARRIAAHHGVDLTAVAGSGPRGAIRRRDVEAAMTARAPTHPIMPVPETHAENGVPFSPMRRTIATRMHQSLLTTAQMTDVHEFVVTPLAELRTRLAARAGALGFKVSYMDLLVRAVALALREVPELNATATEDRVTVHADVDLGVAVAIPDGLVVPVLRRADHLGVRAGHAELDRHLERAPAREL